MLDFIFDVKIMNALIRYPLNCLKSDDLVDWRSTKHYSKRWHDHIDEKMANNDRALDPIKSVFTFTYYYKKKFLKSISLAAI